MHNSNVLSQYRTVLERERECWSIVPLVAHQVLCVTYTGSGAKFSAEKQLNSCCCGETIAAAVIRDRRVGVTPTMQLHMSIRR